MKKIVLLIYDNKPWEINKIVSYIHNIVPHTLFLKKKKKLAPSRNQRQKIPNTNQFITSY